MGVTCRDHLWASVGWLKGELVGCSAAPLSSQTRPSCNCCDVIRKYFDKVIRACSQILGSWDHDACTKIFPFPKNLCFGFLALGDIVFQVIVFFTVLFQCVSFVRLRLSLVLHSCAFGSNLFQMYGCVLLACQLPSGATRDRIHHLVEVNQRIIPLNSCGTGSFPTSHSQLCVLRVRTDLVADAERLKL